MITIKRVWQGLRRLSGDDAYERYLEHFNRVHLDEGADPGQKPLDKAEYFKQWQEQKWNGVKRCC